MVMVQLPLSVQVLKGFVSEAMVRASVEVGRAIVAVACASTCSTGVCVLLFSFFVWHSIHLAVAELAYQTGF